MPVLIHKGVDWKSELATLRRDCVHLRQNLFESCCDFQRDPTFANLKGLASDMMRLRTVERRKRELEEVEEWIVKRVHPQD